AEITDFWAMVFNPSSVVRLAHVVLGCWQAGAFLVLSVSAFYLLRQRHEAFAKASMRIALPIAVVACSLQVVTGHQSALVVSRHQPAKLAAFEGHYPAQAPAPLHVAGWVDERRERTVGLKIPGALSWLVHGDARQPVTGLQAFPPADRPPVQITFQAFHGMVAIGIGLLGLSLLGLWTWWRGTLWTRRGLLWGFVFAVLGPQIANQLGWFAAEVGRQPWIVYGLMRTSEGISKVVSAPMILSSLIMFTVIYALLFGLFLFLLDREIRHGPEAADAVDVYARQRYG
ncbi:MAG: cytochrome ubiquinol oxidase subunit I, partial [Candidatus Omnitrophica bacterium]|nr:cytochrome ubiquinol oxidase subunit I [Candidatus Omnitrophota bacterium]